MKRLALICVLGLTGATIAFGQTAAGPSNGVNGNPVTPPLPPPAGTWSALNHQPNFAACQPFLLTDGRIMVNAYGGDNSCWVLTPDNTGSYINGTWSQVASMITARLFYASSVLADGRVIVCGGEYSGASITNTWTNLSEIYDPVANTWTAINPPAGWGNIGDAPCMVLPNGTFLMGSDFNNATAIYDPVANSWSTGGSVANSSSDEEAWTLLPNNTILAPWCFNYPGSAIYTISTNSWSSLGNLPTNLVDPNSLELGPALLLNNGNVLQMGATPFTCLFNPSTNQWTNGPAVPSVGGTALCCADAPAAMEPSGPVLIAMGKYTTANPFFTYPTYMAEYNGTSITQITAPGNAGGYPYNSRMIVLPTGQVMYTTSNASVYVYTPTGSAPSASLPTVATAPATVQQLGTNYPISGTQFNGVSQGSSYGDDSWAPTNYPLLRIKNTATGHVFYARTHDHSTMSVATGSTSVSTKFDVPTTVETGPSTLYVVANGIASTGTAVNVVGPNVYLPSSESLYRGTAVSGSVSSLNYADGSYLVAGIGPVLNRSESPVQFVVSGTTTVTNPTSTFSLTVRGHASSTNVQETVYLYNYTTNSYDNVGTLALSTADQTLTVTPTNPIADYVNPANGAIQAKVAAIQTGATLQSHWTVSLDQVNWTIQ